MGQKKTRSAVYRFRMIFISFKTKSRGVYFLRVLFAELGKQTIFMFPIFNFFPKSLKIILFLKNVQTRNNNKRKKRKK